MDNLKSHNKKLYFEDYDSYLKHLPNSNLATTQLNKVIRLHGFYMLRDDNRKRSKILEAVNEIGDLMSPTRSTLSETSSIHGNTNIPLTIDEVNLDLNALQWRDDDDFSVQSLEYFSFSEVNNGSVQLYNCCGNNKRKRGRKVKQRKVFNPVIFTKPRSKNKKRKKLTDI